MVSKIILVFAIVVGTATAAVWIAELPEKPCELAHKEGCYIEKIKDVVPFGTIINPLGECVRIQCSASYIQYASCGVMYTDDPKCHFTGQDVSKPYPDCCPNIECDLDNKPL